MRFYVKDRQKRLHAKKEFIRDCQLVQNGLPPHRVLETDIYITKLCNLRCSYCYFYDYFESPEHPLPTDPSLDDLKKLVDQISGKTYCLVVLGGEPFSRPDFLEFLKYVRTKDIYSVRISSNGLYIKRKQNCLHLIDRLNVSFDCTREKQYPERMRGLLKDICDVKAEMGDEFPRLCMAWTAGPDDNFENEIRPLLDYAIENDFEVKFLPVKIDRHVQWNKYRELVLQSLSYAPTNVVTNELTHTLKLSPDYLRENCLQNIQYYIDFEGNFLYPCDEYPEQRVGSVYGQQLEQLWQQGIVKFGAFPKASSVCVDCPSGCHSDNSFIFSNPDRQIQELE